MSNISTFRSFLQQKNIYMEEVQEETGGVFFRSRQTLEQGGQVILVVAFNDREDLIDLNIYNIANITNPLKKEQLLELINDLNVSYRFTKFMEIEGRVSAQYSFKIEPNYLDGNQVLDLLLMLLRTVEDNYPKFMKLQWA